MPARRFYLTETGFAILTAAGRPSSIGRNSGPFRVVVESLEAGPGNPPFRILAKAARADVWVAELPAGTRFVLRIKDRDTGRLVRVVMDRLTAMQFASRVIGGASPATEEELDDAA